MIRKFFLVLAMGMFGVVSVLGAVSSIWTGRFAGDGTSLTNIPQIGVNNLANANGSTLIGSGAGQYNISLGNDFFAVTQAGQYATNADNCVFIGCMAGQNATNANSSQFFGYYAGRNAANANGSMFFGNHAGENGTNASSSQFYAYQAGKYGAGASGSQFFGANAGMCATNASTSVFIGYAAGSNCASANHSIFLGVNSGTNRANTLWIDSQAPLQDGSYQPLVYGEFDNRKLVINGILIVTNGLASLKQGTNAPINIWTNVAAGATYWTNTTGFSGFALVGGGTVSALALNGTDLGLGANTGLATVPVSSLGYIQITYTVAPKMVWVYE